MRFYEQPLLARRAVESVWERCLARMKSRAPAVIPRRYNPKLLPAFIIVCGSNLDLHDAKCATGTSVKNFGFSFGSLN